VKVIHGTGDVAVHAQSRETVTEIVDEPPAGGNEVAGVFTDAWQRVVDGAVTFVDAELPQASAAVAEASAAKSRAVREFTLEHMQKTRRRSSVCGSDLSEWACYTEVLQRNTI